MINYQIYIKKVYTVDTTTLSMPSNITGHECINRLKQLVPHHLNIENINNMEFVLMGQNLNLNIAAEEGPAFIPQNNDLLIDIFGNVSFIGFYIREINRNNLTNINQHNIIYHNNYNNNHNNNHNNNQNNNIIHDTENSEEDDTNNVNTNVNVNTNINVNINDIEENGSIRSLKCIICLENNREIRFNPCGHLICCQTCAWHPTLLSCPTCRAHIQERQITYIP